MPYMYEVECPMLMINNLTSFTHSSAILALLTLHQSHFLFHLDAYKLKFTIITP